MVVLGDAAAAGVRLAAVGQHLAPRHEPVRAVGPSVTQTVGLPADAHVDGEFVDGERRRVRHVLFPPGILCGATTYSICVASPGASRVAVSTDAPGISAFPA